MGAAVAVPQQMTPCASSYRSPGQVKTGTWEGGGGRRGRGGRPGADAVAGPGQVKGAAVAVSTGCWAVTRKPSPTSGAHQNDGPA